MFPNWLDMLVALLTVAGAYRGYRRGLVREGMAFAGLVVGMVIASRWRADAAKAISPFVGSGGIADALGYGGLVLLVLGCATVLTLLLRKLMHVLLVGWLDAVGGGLFGAAQGAIVAGIVLFLLIRFQLFGVEGAVRDSELATTALGMLPGAIGLLPSELGSLARFFEIPK